MSVAQKKGRTARQAGHKMPSLADRRALAAHNPASDDIIAAGTQIKEDAALAVTLDHPIVGAMLQKCYYHICTTAVPTFAVTAPGEGYAMLLFNPEFAVKLGVAGAKLVLFHEAMHMALRHLRVDPELAANDTFSVACEAVINHLSCTRMGVKLPVIVTTDPVTGKTTREPTGVDPKKVYADYKKDLEANGNTPVDYRDFVKTDMDCFRELQRMSSPPGTGRSKKYRICVHQTLGEGDAHGGDPDAGTPTGQDAPGGGSPASTGLPMDQDTVDKVVSEALEQTMAQALKGRADARQDLLDLAGATESGSERASKIWGNLGLGALRGETVKTRKVTWWHRWLKQVIGSKLVSGSKLIYPRKRASVLIPLGHEVPMMHRGPAREKTILIAYDTSGSMSDHVLKKIFSLVGQIPNVTARWVAFDTNAIPFEPGERAYGGGGTSFQGVVDYAEGRLAIDGATLDVVPDAVLVVTDGYAPEVSPKEPRKWIWLITEGGDTWPETAGADGRPAMSCARIDPPGT